MKKARIYRIPWKPDLNNEALAWAFNFRNSLLIFFVWAGAGAGHGHAGHKTFPSLRAWARLWVEPLNEAFPIRS